jgi:hypothetical protein
MRYVRNYLFGLICAASIICGVAAVVRPYERYYADSSARIPLRWQSQPIHISFSTSLKEPPPNIKAGSDVEGAALRALKRWEEAAGVRFVVSWSEEESGDKGSHGDAISLITVADTPTNRKFFKEDALGYTNVLFNTSTGRIGEADIIISPVQRFSTDGTPGTFDLESTLTHEVGHLLGLNHTDVPGAVMQADQFVNGAGGRPRFEGRILSEDDRAGAQAIYGP